MTRDRAWMGFRIAISAAAITGALAGARILRAQTAPAAWKIHQRSFTLAANQTAEEWLENVIPAEVLKDHGSFAEKALLMRGTDVVDSADFQSDPAYPNSGSWSFTSGMDRAFRQIILRPAFAVALEDEVRIVGHYVAINVFQSLLDKLLGETLQDLDRRCLAFRVHIVGKSSSRKVGVAASDQHQIGVEPSVFVEHARGDRK